MKITKASNKIILLYKWISFVAIVGCTVPLFASNTEGESKQVVVVTDSVKGQITDAVTGVPVAGARVQTFDLRYSAMTDEQGHYTLRLAPFINTIVVSAPGYENREMPVFKGVQKKNISIYPSVFGSFYSNEHMVFGTKRKSAVATAVRSFDIENQSSMSVDAELKSKMAGDIRLLTFSGSPAAGGSMLIRGINSLNSHNMPLLVVDGVIFDNQTDRSSLHMGHFLNSLSGIDVSDIQSLTVLKDGTSMYGSKGGNGVILINTNRGRSMATKITVTGMLGYVERPSVTPMMNADQYRIYLSDLLKSPVAQSNLTDQFFLNDDPNFVYYNKYHNTTNWSDGIYRDGTTQSYNVAVNGGDDIALYNLSIGLTNALSTLQKNDFYRINARFNSDINLNDKLNTAFDISYLQITRKLRNDGIAEKYRTQINSPGYLSLIKSPFLSPYQYSVNRELTTRLEGYDFLKVANPYAVLDFGSGHTQQTKFNLAIVPTYKLNTNITLSSRFSYSLINLSENMYSPMYGIAPYIDRNNDVISNNHVKTQFARQNSILSDTRLNWKQTREQHSYELNAGVRYISDSYKAEYAEGHNTGSDQVREMSGSLQYKLVDGVDDPFKQLAYYGTFDYGYKEKYFAEAALAVETSSRFGANPQSGFNLLGVGWAVFPSINAGWLISSEDFMQDVEFVNMLKLRAGIGMSGNDGIQSTASNAYFKAVKYAYNATGVVLNNIANPTIQWETVTKRNVGIDANLFSDRLSLYADLFSNSTDNLLVQKSLEPYSGIGMYWTNDGKLQNTGFEAGFEARVISTRNLSFTLGASISSYANKIVALADGDYLTSVYGAEVLTAINKPIGQFYGYQTNGVFATADEAAQAGLSTYESTGALVPFDAGDVRFVDQNNDKIIDDNDKVVIGNSNPEFFGGLNAGLKYKSIGIRMDFSYTYGNEIYNFLRSQVEGGSTFNNQSVAVVNRWVSEGQSASLPASVFGDPKMNNRFSDRWVEDGSYLRLRTLEVSWELPVHKVQFLQGVTLWASANNLFTLTNYLGVDPEFSSGTNILYQGIDTGLLPQSRSFNAGFKVYL